MTRHHVETIIMCRASPLLFAIHNRRDHAIMMNGYKTAVDVERLADIQQLDGMMEQIIDAKSQFAYIILSSN